MARRRKGRAVTGILVLDKPVGPSSNQVLQRVRHLFNAAKAGHTGNLDPLASGVLPICLGEATKLSQFLLDSDKAYQATVSFGVKTTTGDSEGEVVEERNVASLTTDEVTAVLNSFVGVFDQTQPMHSALKVDGQPLYKLARQGKEVERKARRIEVHSIEMLSFKPGAVATSDIRVSCSKGTYIRTLSEDIAAALGLPGHMSALRRTATGPFDLRQSVDLETLVGMAETRIQILHNSDHVKETWQEKVPDSNRPAYSTSKAPGTELEEGEAAPTTEQRTSPNIENCNDGENNFCIIRATITHLELLQLNPDGAHNRILLDMERATHQRLVP